MLGLHRVVKDFQVSARNYMPSMLISTSRLEQYLDWVARRHRFSDLKTVAHNYYSTGNSDNPLVAITFDDGYRDIYYNAFPLLRRKRIPFAVFVVTDLVGTDNLQIYDELFLLLKRAMQVWAPEIQKKISTLLDSLNIAFSQDMTTKDHFKLTRGLLHELPQSDLVRVVAALRDALGPVDKEDSSSLLSLTWEMIEEMRDAGVTIGSHTRSHTLLTNETPERALEEMRGSKLELENRLGEEVTQFAYPDGKFNSDIAEMAATVGYHAAYTTATRHDPTNPLLTIPRRMLWETSGMTALGNPSPLVLECLINGMFDKPFKNVFVKDH